LESKLPITLFHSLYLPSHLLPPSQLETMSPIMNAKFGFCFSIDFTAFSRFPFGSLAEKTFVSPMTAKENAFGALAVSVLPFPEA